MANTEYTCNSVDRATRKKICADARAPEATQSDGRLSLADKDREELMDT